MFPARNKTSGPVCECSAKATGRSWLAKKNAKPLARRPGLSKTGTAPGRERPTTQQRFRGSASRLDERDARRVPCLSQRRRKRVSRSVEGASTRAGAVAERRHGDVRPAKRNGLDRSGLGQEKQGEHEIDAALRLARPADMADAAEGGPP